MAKRALLAVGLGLGLTTSASAVPVNSAGTYQAAPSDNAIFEVLGRLEQLQSEVQQLRGMVEEQSQTIADLQRKQNNMYSDLDDRMQALSAAGQPAAAQPAVGQQPDAVVAPAPAAQTVAPAVAATVPAASAASAAAPTPAVQPAPAPVPETKPAPTTVAGNEKERYQTAYETLRNGHNAQAVKMFQDLLKDFPAGEFADNSQYWLAEAYKINREFDAARAAFNKVVSQYPNSSKVPDALLKLGYIEFDLQNTAKARDYLTRVTTSYPGTTAAHLAEKKLAQMSQ
ncbi:tol-pal system protein YbgF [Methylomonas sp. SURF-1]|uniref:Cell division coordinator CpoB n=1 Tax=Methylomonas aurea TaxID=2952224 RepID=A0ABT1UM53_9GAMM|nr:tol-pal system protein YbgF [Methylomonas sp. SURF-1]MCQ8183116.1 tol-pal system protein YbgF [Methylomonas sp. SURF-1]